MAGLIHCPLAGGASRQPDAPALIQGDGTPLSYAELHHTCREVAATLPDWPAGTRVALVEPDRGHLIRQIVACWYRRWTAVPLDHRMTGAALAQVCGDLNLRPWPRSKAGAAPPRERSPRPEGGDTSSAMRTGLTMRWTARQPATMTLTSGSTGTPKAVIHTFGNHAASAAGLRRTLELDDETHWLVSLPLFHIGGLALLWRVWSAGGALVLPGTHLHEALLQGVTHASLVPAQVLRLGPAPERPVLRCLMLGGEAVSEHVWALARHWAHEVVISYGCSEATSTVALARSAGGPFEVLPGREVGIDGGELRLGGDVLAAGYWDGRSVSPLNPGDGGWPTGDGACWVQPPRTFTLTGRLDRRFISGGENIQPEAIERVLLSCEGVSRVAVVPVPDPVFGQRPVAYIHPPEALNPERLAAQLAKQLPRYMCPDVWLAWPDPDTLKPPLKQWQALATRLCGKK
ncbi:MAG: 2-succinylbenzoate-CoA ligase [Gammaproteobacteria bacterium]|nr:MAG: 2-succinylbenzoate-CoA ligase [Gammaproteobacteria bacterium]